MSISIDDVKVNNKNSICYVTNSSRNLEIKPMLIKRQVVDFVEMNSLVVTQS